MRPGREEQQEGEAGHQYRPGAPGRIERTAEAARPEWHAEVIDAERRVERERSAQPLRYQIGRRPRRLGRDAEERGDEVQRRPGCRQRPPPEECQQHEQRSEQQER